MIGTYSPGLVSLSIAVAILASYTALDLAKRISRLKIVRHRHYWLSGGALAMGIGIWASFWGGLRIFGQTSPTTYGEVGTWGVNDPTIGPAIGGGSADDSGFGS